MPLVSVVVPSFRRPQLLERAVRSALAQTIEDLEVVVVLDGPHDPDPVFDALNSDRRVRIHQLSQRQGANAARNEGVAEARGQWVAFLDDDDVWLPRKIEQQLLGAVKSRFRRPIMACQAISRSPRSEMLMPRRRPDPGEPACEYLFCRRGPLHGEGLLQTSTLLAPRSLCMEAPWPSDIRRFHEAFWLLNASSLSGAGIEVILEPLSVWLQDEDRTRLTLDGSNWQLEFGYARRHAHLFTARAYAAFIMSAVTDVACRGRGGFGARAALLHEAYQNGEPSLTDLLVFMNVACVPASIRSRMRDRVVRWRRSGKHIGTEASSRLSSGAA